MSKELTKSDLTILVSGLLIVALTMLLLFTRVDPKTKDWFIYATLGLGLIEILLMLAVIFPLLFDRMKQEHVRDSVG